MKQTANRRFISLIIVFTMLLSTTGAMISCSDTDGGDSADNSSDTQQPDETTESETEKPTALSTVAVKDFEKAEFKIVATNQDSRHIDVVAEELTGATLNDLVYARNMKIEELFNVKIIAEAMDYGQINSLVKSSSMAGDNPYDMYMTNATSHSLASEGMVMAFNDIPNIDITKEWWDQTAVSGLSVGNKVYMIIGDISPTELLTSECVLFNKNLFDTIGVEYPYQTAFDGKWTLDAMYEIAQGLTKDLNGDGVIDLKTDLYAVTAWNDYGEAMFYGAGGRMTTKDSNDYPVLAWDIEKYSNIYEKIYKLFITNEGNYGTNGDHEYTFKIFNEGRAYFCGITFQKIEMFLRDMENDYGVLPVPKYDENQDRYSTCVSGAGTFLVVPKSASELEKIGTITEALAAASYDMITPSLYEVVASTKNVRDMDSSKMVQMIIRNRVFDMAHMFYFTGSTFTSTLLGQKSTDVASYFAKMEKVAAKEIEKLITNYTKNNQ